MLSTLGTMLLFDRKLSKEEQEKKAKKKLKLIEERRKRIQNELDELDRTKELFFAQDIEVEDLK